LIIGPPGGTAGNGQDSWTYRSEFCVFGKRHAHFVERFGWKKGGDPLLMDIGWRDRALARGYGSTAILGKGTGRENLRWGVTPKKKRLTGTNILTVARKR